MTLEPTMDRETAILAIADVLDPLTAGRRAQSIERAEALLEDWMLHPPFTVDAAPYAEAVSQITEEETLWNND